MTMMTNERLVAELAETRAALARMRTWVLAGMVSFSVFVAAVLVAYVYYEGRIRDLDARSIENCAASNVNRAYTHEVIAGLLRNLGDTLDIEQERVDLYLSAVPELEPREC
jgi:hypothetical protein